MPLSVPVCAFVYIRYSFTRISLTYGLYRLSLLSTPPQPPLLVTEYSSDLFRRLVKCVAEVGIVLNDSAVGQNSLCCASREIASPSVTDVSVLRAHCTDSIRLHAGTALAKNGWRKNSANNIQQYNTMYIISIISHTCERQCDGIQAVRMWHFECRSFSAECNAHRRHSRAGELRAHKRRHQTNWKKTNISTFVNHARDDLMPAFDVEWLVYIVHISYFHFNLRSSVDTWAEGGTNRTDRMFLITKPIWA